MLVLFEIIHRLEGESPQMPLLASVWTLTCSRLGFDWAGMTVISCSDPVLFPLFLSLCQPGHVYANLCHFSGFANFRSTTRSPDRQSAIFLLVLHCVKTVTSFLGFNLFLLV